MERYGAGKSSIYIFLLNFDKYDCETLIDDIDIKQVNIIDCIDLITYVPQESRLFDKHLLQLYIW